MNEKVSMHFLADNKYAIYDVEKIVVGRNETFGHNLIKLKVCINGIEYIADEKADGMNVALRYLDKELPDYIVIACCFTCDYGYRCPWAHYPNIRYCLKNCQPSCEEDLIDIFEKYFDNPEAKILEDHELIYWCEDYQ